MSLASVVAPDPNQHVVEYLTYYIGFAQPPRYAVMLSGRWGVGKTHQVKKVVGTLLAGSASPAGKRFVLVSLYGLKTPQEIDDAMVAALYPWSDNDSFKIAASVGKAILKHAKIELPELKADNLINRMSADVFIFDDLERCRMPVTDAFGYINQLVERDGCKVIVLANEHEIHKKDDQKEPYRLGKEKLIGKTLEVEPDFNAAFFDFLKGITDQDTQSLFKLRQTQIQEVYQQSASKNLRILQQSLWDFERVFRVISPRHRANDNAMHHFLRLFLALCFEFKAGHLSSDDLEERTTISLIDAMRKDDDSAPFSSAGAKYPGLYLYDSILSDRVMSDILVRGVVDGDAIGQALDTSSWFVSTNEPAWRTLWHASERSDVDVQEAATTMLAQFDRRHYASTGEMLHLFGQMLWLADLGISGRDRAKTVSDSKAYVDDLRKQGRLESSTEVFLDSIRFGSFGGLGFYQNGTSEFRELWTYVAGQRERAEDDAFLGQVVMLMDLMGSNPSEFVRKITYQHDGVAPFANKPVLAKSDPDEFAERMIALKPLAFREVLLGLSARYDMAKLADKRELSGERQWADTLEAALLRKAAGLGAFGKDRIAKNVEWTLGKELKELREAETQRIADT